MAQSRSEPPPDSDFSESFFFSLNSTLSESFGKIGQIDQIWGCISEPKGWKATKYPMFTLILQCACHYMSLLYIR